MACLNTYDLIAYPGNRYSTTFTAATKTELVDKLQKALTKSNWTLVADGAGWKATSKQIPWCVNQLFEAQPADFVGKCKVAFYPNNDVGIFGTLTRFYVMNEDETMKQSESVEIFLRSTIGDYANYKYFFIGNPYQFSIFMLGTNERFTNEVTDQWTAVMAGVPQIPKFLQATADTDGPNYCKYGIRELFFIWQMDKVRQGALYGHNNSWCAGIKSQFGEYLNNNQGGNSPMIHSGLQGGGVFDAGTSPLTGNWINTGGSISGWSGLFYSPIISWLTQVTDTYAKLKGFLWDAIVINKMYNADDILNFDGHNFIVFNTFAGGTFPTRPPQALCLAITGVV